MNAEGSVRHAAARISHVGSARTRADHRASELVGCDYSTGAYVRLVFDRAVDVAALVAEAFVVADGNVGVTYQGSGSASPLTPEVVELPLTTLSVGAGAGVVLTVGAGNGIVAASDGEPWGGTGGVAIPFP